MTKTADPGAKARQIETALGAECARQGTSNAFARDADSGDFRLVGRLIELDLPER
jgi:hypothetical protein